MSLLADQPDRSEIRTLLASRLLDDGQHARALFHLTYLLEESTLPSSHPKAIDLSAIYYGRARCFSQLGELSRAVDDLRTAITMRSGAYPDAESLLTTLEGSAEEKRHD